MKVIPAIDIKGGKVVRLAQGSAGKETVYSDSPLEVAEMWDSLGAGLIHIVDLDGAFEGKLRNFEIVKKIAGAVKAKIELGGGIRDEEAVRSVLGAGVEKVVIGTKALADEFLGKVAKIFRKKIVVGIDARRGIVRTKGWVFSTGVKALDLVRKVEEAGIGTINYTDISRDGMLEGPNLEALREVISSTTMDVIASGGISSMQDLKNLKELEPAGLKGVIIGKALYDKKVNLSEAIRVCEE